MVEPGLWTSYDKPQTDAYAGQLGLGENEFGCQLLQLLPKEEVQAVQALALLDVLLVVRGFESEDYQRPPWRRDDLEQARLVLSYQCFETMCELDGGAQMLLKPADTVGAEDEPDLETSESSSERDLEVAQIEHVACIAVFGAQVFRCDGKCAREMSTISKKNGRTVELHQPPLVKVGAKAVHFATVDRAQVHRGAQFGERQTHARIRCVNVKPQCWILMHYLDDF